MVEANASSSGSVEDPSTADPHRTQQYDDQDQTLPSHPHVSAACSAMQAPGSMLGPYRLDSKLGEGGMGAVYKATHTKLGKVVAVKVLPSHLTRQKDSVARFEREMLAVGKLTHPHIVQAHDAGEINGTHYLAMEYVDGTDLAAYVKQRGSMSVTNACKAVRQAAQALAAAHADGLIHRDIKPSNMLLAKATGQIKLLDLGLARLVDDAAPLPEITVAGDTFGTPDYMAPEQWENSHTADARTDLYAVGCTLFYLLTGRAPYGDDQHRQPLHKMTAHVSKPIPDLKSFRPEVPDGVDAIYRKLLAKKSADRFQTAKELADALQPFTSSKPSTTAATVPELLPVIVTESVLPPQPPRKKNNWPFFAGGFGALALLGVIVIIITNKDGTKTKVEVPAGTQKVEITKDGKTVSTVTPDPSPATPSVPPITPAETAAKFFAEQREVAEFVLSRGGSVNVEWVDEMEELAKSPTLMPGAPVPAGKFAIRNIDLDDPMFTGTGLPRLAFAQNLFWLQLNFSQLERKDAARLADFSRLYWLGLLSSSLKTSELPRLVAPVEFAVSAGMVDDQWEFLSRCPNLRHVLLAGNNDDPTALPDLVQLGKHAQLRTLTLRDRDISEEIVHGLQQANPRLRVIAKDNRLVGRDPQVEAGSKLLERGAEIYGFGFTEPTSKTRQLTADQLKNGTLWRIADMRFSGTKSATPDDIREFTAFAGTLGNVVLDGQRDSDQLARSLAELGYLFSLTLSNSDLSDTGLAALQRFDKLTYLDIRGNPQVTKAGVAAFHKAVPACRLFSDHGGIPADWVAVPVRANPDSAMAKFFAQQREIAEFVLSRGGKVLLHWYDSEGDWTEPAQPDKPLPDRKFAVWHIEFGPTLKGSDFTRLLPARQLYWLSIASSHQTQQDVQQLAEFSLASSFTLSNSSLKTSWLPKLPAPMMLEITPEMVDDHWSFVGRCANLRTLRVYLDAIPDLAPLGQYAQLRWLDVPDADVSPDVVKTLQERNPRLRITAKGKLVGRDPVTESAQKLLDRGATLYSEGRLFGAVIQERLLTAGELQNDGPWQITDVRFVAGKQATADDVQEFTAFAATLQNVILDGQRNADQLARSMTELGYLHGLTYANSDLTDAGLAALQRFDKLMYLDVRGNPQITASGVATFHRAVPRCRLLNDHGEIPADLIAVPERPKLVSEKPFDPAAKFFAQQREVAEFILSRGGTVHVGYPETWGNENHIFRPGMELPDRNLAVGNVLLNDPTLNGSDIPRLLPVPHAIYFTIPYTKFQAKEEAECLAALTRINSLNIAETSLKTAWLPRLTGPTEMSVSPEMVDDDWAFLGRCPQLRVLGVIGEQAPIPDMSPIGRYQQLRWLWLNNADIAEPVLAELQRQNPLLRVTTKDRLVGRDPVKEAALKLRERGAIIRGWGLFSETAADYRELSMEDVRDGGPWRITAVDFTENIAVTNNDLRLLTAFDGTLAGVKVVKQQDSDQLVKELTGLSTLQTLVYGGSDLSDAGLRELQRMDRLRYLNVTQNPKLTKDAIEAFHRAVPACRILNDHSDDILPDLVAVPQRSNAERNDK